VNKRTAEGGIERGMEKIALCVELVPLAKYYQNDQVKEDCMLGGM
jgi:hypothetical protein